MTDASSQSHDGRVWHIMKGSWWALLLGAVIGAVAAYGIATHLPKSYESTATLLVGPVNTDLALDASGSLTTTYEGLVTSVPVLRTAISDTGAHLTPLQLEKAIATSSNTVSRFVTITVSNADPVMAANLANALAKRISTLATTSPQTANAAIAAFDGEPEVQALDQAKRTAVESALQRVIGVSPAGQVTVVNAAVPANAPASPKKGLIAILGALAGTVIALLILLASDGRRGTGARERLPDSLDMELLEELDVDVEMLGEVELVSPRESAEGGSADWRPQSSTTAGYTLLAARLNLVQRSGHPRSLLVVDPDDGSAAGIVAANLATTLAQMNGDGGVLLADVSGEPRGATRTLGMQGRRGFAELLLETDFDALSGRLTDYFVDYGEDLQVLPHGDAEVAPPSPERAGALVRSLAETAETVVLSGSSLARSPSGLVWAPIASSVLLVIEPGRSSYREIAQAVDDLSLVSSQFLGAVVARRPSGVPLLGRSLAGRA